MRIKKPPVLVISKLSKKKIINFHFMQGTSSFVGGYFEIFLIKKEL
jgi:hypothetical protein